MQETVIQKLEIRSVCLAFKSLNRTVACHFVKNQHEKQNDLSETRRSSNVTYPSQGNVPQTRNQHAHAISLALGDRTRKREPIS